MIYSEELTWKNKLKGRPKDVGEPSMKRVKHEDHMTSEEEEQEYERVPRSSTWDQGGGGGEKKGVHYLLPLKADHGRLIQQDPTHIQPKGQPEICLISASYSGNHSLDSTRQSCAVK